MAENSFTDLLHSLTVTDAVQLKSIEVTTKQNEIVEMGKLIANDKEAAEETMTTALQPLKSAKLLLTNLEKSELTDMLETETPPEAVEIVGECFVILKGIREVSWKTVRSIMAEENFFKSLMEMNCDAITTKQLAQCKNHMKVSTIPVFAFCNNFIDTISCCRKWISVNWQKSR